MKNIHNLLEGYKQFKRNYFENPSCDLFKKLHSEGQKPKAIVIACSDSRVDPALLLNADPGDLFVVRNVANLVPPCEQDSAHHGTSAALEFAVCGLQVEHIIIIGHSQCGGIASLVSGSPALTEHSFIGTWMELARPALKITEMTASNQLTLEQRGDMCARHALVCSLDNLKTFPWIQCRMASGSLKLHAWFFDIKEGNLLCYDADQKDFKIMNGNPIV